MSQKRVLIIGGGAAGYFASITLAEACPYFRVVLAESQASPLRKVKVSGGQRCNLTNATYDSRELVLNYPRGGKALLSLFSRFQPEDTVAWFESRGVVLKTQKDRRVFPSSNSSQTVIDCLEGARVKSKVSLRLSTQVVKIKVLGEKEFLVNFRYKQKQYAEYFDFVVVATGGLKKGEGLVAGINHTLSSPVPSLFTFVVEDPRIKQLSGISVENVSIKLKCKNGRFFEEEGSILITHWGLSGPAIIKLSAWAAKELALSDYRAKLIINWCGAASESAVEEALILSRKKYAKKTISKVPLFNLPLALWSKLCEASGISSGAKYAELSKALSQVLKNELLRGEFLISGKGKNKEEFVTCGGVVLGEIDLSKMESKLIPGLYFAGEVLDIDGITGGFNFQLAWTTGYIAGMAIAGQDI